MQRITQALTVVALGVGVAACSTPTPSLETTHPSPPSPVPLTQFTRPPENPPSVIVGDVELSPTNASWLLKGGERNIIAPAEDFSVADLPTVVVDPTSMRFAVDSPVMPGQFDITTFNTVDPAGIPEGQGSSVNCLADSTCALIVNGEDATLDGTASLDKVAKVMVFHVYYFVESLDEEGTGQAIETNYASYAVRISQ